MSRFHEEFFKQNGTGHDELLLKCLSEEGLEKIKAAFLLEQSATKSREIDVWRCPLTDGKFRYQKSVPRLDPQWGYELPPRPGSNKVFGEIAYRRMCSHEQDCNNIDVCQFFQDGTSGLLVKCTQIPYIEKLDINYQSEIIVNGGRGFILGYADLLISFVFHRKALISLPNGENWTVEERPYSEHVLIEVKPDLKDVGAVLRQIKTYAEHIPGRLAVVTYTNPTAPILRFLDHEGVKVLVFERPT